MGGLKIVTLFRNFVEDYRTSMEVYADNLFSELLPLSDGKLKLREYRPTVTYLKGLANAGKTKMRLCRYVSYPWLARRHQADLNHIIDHGYGHLLYFLDPARTIVTVHDLIPLLHWKGVIRGTKRNRKPWLNEFSFQSLKLAKHLIAVSENTKSDLIHHCGCLEKNITVIYYGVNKKFVSYSQDYRERLRCSFGFPDKHTNLVLITGGVFYKNQMTSLKVLSALIRECSRPVNLIVVGKSCPEWENAKQEAGLTGNVIELDFIPHGKMPDLYNCVDCLLFPSLYEGFGWPPLEAMACGTAVITSNVASLPEVVGGAGLMANPYDVDALTRAVKEVLENQSLRSSLKKKGISRSSEFSWEKNAEKTIELYKTILST